MPFFMSYGRLVSGRLYASSAGAECELMSMSLLCPSRRHTHSIGAAFANPSVDYDYVIIAWSLVYFPFYNLPLKYSLSCFSLANVQADSTSDSRHGSISVQISCLDAHYLLVHFHYFKLRSVSCAAAAILDPLRREKIGLIDRNGVTQSQPRFGISLQY